MDNSQTVAEFRANRGKVKFFSHLNLLLVTAKGAKTGKETTFPVAYSKDGERYVIVASKGGSPTNPAWYYNLLANPEVTVEDGQETFKARATNVTGKERDRLFEQHAKQYPQFNDYQAKTSRVIPVFVLEKI